MNGKAERAALNRGAAAWTITSPDATKNRSTPKAPAMKLGSRVAMPAPSTSSRA